MRDSQHTQNVQINKVIGENEKCVFYFMEETKQKCWSTQHMHESIEPIILRETIILMTVSLTQL